MGDEPANYISNYYLNTTYKVCYELTAQPINGENLWPSSNKGPILPLKPKRPAGRPKTLRRYGLDEPEPTHKPRRVGTSLRFSKSQKYGHNQRMCNASKRSSDNVGNKVIRVSTIVKQVARKAQVSTSGTQDSINPTQPPPTSHS